MTTLAEHAQLLEWFWEVVGGMEVEDQAKVLAFACGNCRVPAAGFAALQARPVASLRACVSYIHK